MNYQHKTWREVADAWARGDIVATASLGGISPGYEQAIQILLFEMMYRWEGDFPKPGSSEDELNEFYKGPWDKHAEAVTRSLDESLGVSGAQFGVAKNTAFQFMYYGYTEMLDKLEEDRHLLVSKSFPKAPPIINEEEKKDGG